MKFVALALVFTVAAVAVAEPVNPRIPFKNGVQYTYSYVTEIEIPNPVVQEQTVALRLECQLLLRFKASEKEKSRAIFGRSKIVNPVFTVIEKNPSISPLPLETIIPNLPIVLKQLRQGFSFNQFNGNIYFLKLYGNQWTRNLKRGIASLFSLNVVGKNDDDMLYTKVERTIFGQCECLYNQNNTLSEQDTLNIKPIRIIKNIETNRCRNPLAVNMATVSRELGTVPMEKIHRTISIMDVEILRSRSNWKLLTARNNATIMFQPLGENKLPILTKTYQILELIDEDQNIKTKVIIPGWPKNLKRLEMEVPKTIEMQRTPLKGNKLVSFIYQNLLSINEKMTNETTTYTEETTLKLTELVQILRSLPKPALLKIWNNIVPKKDVKMTTLFMRVFALIRTEPSLMLFAEQANSLENNLVTKDIIREVLLLQSTPVNPTTKMIELMENVCQIRVIKSDNQLEAACFLSLVSIRKIVCAFKECKRPLPSELRDILKPTEMIKLQPVMMLQYILVAETAAETSLLTPLLNLIRTDIELPLFVRSRAIRALKPLVHKIGVKVTNQIMELINNRNFKQSEELKLDLYSIVLEKPNPTNVHACVTRLIVAEKSVVVRRFIYETLLALAVRKNLGITEETRKACLFAVKELRAKRLVPKNLRVIPSHHIQVIKPFTETNIEMLLKNEIHYDAKSAFPKHLVSTLDIDLFGRRFNFLDLNIAVEGIQELFTKWMKASSETDPIVEMSALASLNILNQPCLSMYKQITRKQPKTLLEKALPTTFWTWNNLANQINKELNINTQKTMMPVEVTMRLPTPVGIPLTYHLQTIVMYELKTSVHTDTPSIFDLPRLAFANKQLNLNAALKHRSLTTILATIHAKTPVATIGIQHSRFIKAMMNTNITMSLNPQTMEIESDIKMPNIPEIISTASQTELFVNSPLLPVTEKRIPTLMENLLPNMEILGQPKAPLNKLHSTVNLKVNNKYVNVKDSQIVLAEQPQEWVVIPVPGNNRIVSLYLPNIGYIVVEPTTNKLIISSTKQEYFFIDRNNDEQILLKTLVPADLESIRPDEEMEQLLAPVFELVALLQKEGIVTSQVQRALRWRDVDPLKAVKIMFAKFDETATVMVETQTEATLVSQNTIKCSTQQIQLEARSHGVCLDAPLTRMCLHGIVPKKPIVDVNTLLYPMFMDIALPRELTNIKIKHSLKKERDMTARVIKISYIGMQPTEELEMRARINELRTRYTFEVQRIIAQQPRDFLMCYNMTSQDDSLNAEVSFHPQCNINHVELKSALEQPSLNTFPRLQMQLDWILRLESLPMAVKRTLILLVDTLILPQLPIGIEQVPLEYNLVQLLTKKPRLSGTLELSLVTDELLKIPVESKLFPTMEWKLPLPTKMNNLPIGRQNLPLYDQIFERLTMPICKHSLNTFTTFDGVTYKHEIPTPNCEQILVQTKQGFQQSVKITVRKHQENMRAVKMVVDGSKIEVIPGNKAQNIPRIMIHGNLVPFFTNVFEVELTNGHMLKGIWIPEETTLHILINGKGIALTVVGGRTIYTKLHSMIYQGRVQGLCGNMDLERYNELETPERVLVNNPQLFWLTWIAPATECTTKGCPFKRTDVPAGEPKQCVPRIALPKCMSECSVEKTMTIINDVPMKCPGIAEPVLKPYQIPAKCTCSC